MLVLWPFQALLIYRQCWQQQALADAKWLEDPEGELGNQSPFRLQGLLASRGDRETPSVEGLTWDGGHQLDTNLAGHHRPSSQVPSSITPPPPLGGRRTDPHGVALTSPCPPRMVREKGADQDLIATPPPFGGRRADPQVPSPSLPSH